jgi:transposase
MNLHLREIGRAVAPGAQAILVLDGAGWHTSHSLRPPANVTLLCLPPYAPELNPIENVWEYLRKNKLAIRLYETYDDIVDACCNAWTDLLAIPDRLVSITTRQWATVS